MGGAEPQRQDIYSGRRIEWRWVLVGALIVLGLETLLLSSIQALGGNATSLGGFVGATTVAFVVGGAVIGWLSPGWTAWEAGIASAIAVAWTAFLAARLLQFGSGFFTTVPLGLAWGILCGLGGGRIGEWLQGRTRGR